MAPVGPGPSRRRTACGCCSHLAGCQSISSCNGRQALPAGLSQEGGDETEEILEFGQTEEGVADRRSDFSVNFKRRTEIIYLSGQTDIACWCEINFMRYVNAIKPTLSVTQSLRTDLGRPRCVFSTRISPLLGHEQLIPAVGSNEVIPTPWNKPAETETHTRETVLHCGSSDLDSSNTSLL